MNTAVYYRKATMTAGGEIVRGAHAAPFTYKVPSGRTSELTPIQTTEGLSIYTPSAVSLLFSKLNGALAVAIEAERDIEHVNVWDPAIDHWLRDAERAWAAVTEICQALCGAPVIRAEDRPLLKMADIVDALMGAESIIEYLSVQKRLRTAAYQLRCPGLGATPCRITQMLRQCHAHLSVMTRMDVYQPDYDPKDVFDSTQDASPDAC